MLTKLRAAALARRLRCSACRQVIDPDHEVKVDGQRFCSERCATEAWQANQI